MLVDGSKDLARDCPSRLMLRPVKTRPLSGRWSSRQENNRKLGINAGPSKIEYRSQWPLFRLPGTPFPQKKLGLVQDVFVPG